MVDPAVVAAETEAEEEAEVGAVVEPTMVAPMVLVLLRSTSMTRLLSPPFLDHRIAHKAIQFS